MKEVIIATKNEGKVREFKAMLEPRGYDVKSLLDIGYTPEIEETGQTFEENAVIKAETISKETGKIVIADDSGLSVDYLSGGPRRILGPLCRRREKRSRQSEKAIERARRGGKRRPFREVQMRARNMHSRTGNENGRRFCGRVHYRRAAKTNGFGYDPVFLVKDKDQTMAELSSGEKNKISHRAEALKKLSALLDQA